MHEKTSHREWFASAGGCQRPAVLHNCIQYVSELTWVFPVLFRCFLEKRRAVLFRRCFFASRLGALKKAPKSIQKAPKKQRKSIENQPKLVLPAPPTECNFREIKCFASADRQMRTFECDDLIKSSRLTKIIPTCSKIKK